MIASSSGHASQAILLSNLLSASYGPISRKRPIDTWSACASPVLPVEKKFAIFSTKLYFEATSFPVVSGSCLSVSTAGRPGRITANPRNDASSGARQIDKLKGVYPRSFDGQAPMEVRTRNPPCGTHLPQHRTRFQAIAHFHINLGQVPVQRINP